MILQSLEQLDLSVYRSNIIRLRLTALYLSYILESFTVKIDRIFSRFLYINIYLLTAQIFRLSYRIKSKVAQEVIDLDNSKGPYVVVANHISRLDPLLMLAALPFSTFRKIIPLKAFVANIYLKYFGFILQPLGAFHAYSIPGKRSGLREGLRSLDNNFNVLIFPEGKVNRKGRTMELKIGAAYLAQKRPVKLLPVALVRNEGITKIAWGQPFRIDRNFDSVEELNAEIFKRVLDLID